MKVSDNSPAGQAGPSKTSEHLLTPGKGRTAPPTTPELLTDSKGAPHTPDSLVTTEMAPPKAPEPINGKVDVPDGGVSSPESILTPDTGPLEPLLIPGNGQTAILHSLSAETWYHLRFNTRSVTDGIVL